MGTAGGIWRGITYPAEAEAGEDNECSPLDVVDGYRCDLDDDDYAKAQVSCYYDFILYRVLRPTYRRRSSSRNRRMPGLARGFGLW